MFEEEEGLHFSPIKSTTDREELCQTGSESAFIMFKPCCLAVFVVQMGQYRSIYRGRSEAVPVRKGSLEDSFLFL